MHLATFYITACFSDHTWVGLRILVLPPGIKLMLPALGVQSLNYWTSREVLHYNCF